MTGGHAHHEGVEIHKEDGKESEFQWAPIEIEITQEELYQWRLLLMPWLLLMGWVMIRAIKLKKDPQTLL
ncbi:hypothetical protein Tco_1246132 [Tanacetum coccineum]